MTVGEIPKRIADIYQAQAKDLEFDVGEAIEPDEDEDEDIWSISPIGEDDL